MDTKQKYIITGLFHKIIIFPVHINHNEFIKFKPVSAGFLYIDTSKRKVICFGESVSLDLRANEEEDSIIAANQLFGY